jgi:hypothetical protein
MGEAERHSATDWTLIRFRVLKFSVYGLLSFNVYLLLTMATVHEALDSVGWMLLIAAMEYKTSTLGHASTSRQKLLLLGVRALAYALIIHAWVEYLLAPDWMDFANSTVWLLVCVSLEYDVHAPATYMSLAWRIRNTIKLALYASLLGLAVVWGIRGDVLDFYDAFLWIVCFSVIELNVFHFEPSSEGRLQPAMVPASGPGG